MEVKVCQSCESALICLTRAQGNARIMFRCHRCGQRFMISDVPSPRWAFTLSISEDCCRPCSKQVAFCEDCMKERDEN